MTVPRWPPSTRQAPVQETLHGRPNIDPYRWLEDEHDPEVAAWVAAQSAYTEALLAAVPQRPVIQQRLAAAFAIGTVQAPVARKGRYFYTRREGTEDQPRLYLREGLDGPERVLLDPATASTAHTVALDWWYPSDDGRQLAYGYSDHGDEKSTLYVLDVDSGALLPDHIPHTRYSSVAWEPDGGGFYYTRTPAPGSVPPGEEVYHEHLFHHRLSTDPADDPDLFGAGRDMTDTLQVRLSPTGRWLVVWAFQGWVQSAVYVRDLQQSESAFTPITTGRDAIFMGEVLDDTLYLLTNWNAPRYRVLAYDLAQPAAGEREIIAERSDVTLDHLIIAGGRLVLHETRDIISLVGVYSLTGEAQPAPTLPLLGTVTDIHGAWDEPDVFLSFESFTIPPTVYRYNLSSGELTTWAAVRAGVDLSQIIVRQVWYPSKDGTAIPMFIVGPRDLARNGDHPTVLHGYGGFNVSKSPEFLRFILPWLAAGGVFAVANLRGGGEFGEDWHRAGMLERKQNVFDDYLAAADYLIGEGYTRPTRLGIWGRSNGGLLVGAALTQRPDLFQAVACGVPLLDMLRYHHFRIARLWVPEYGSADDPAQAAFLWAYSPYQHVTPGVDYPAVFFYTADSDSRVDPLHARKMTALLQAASPHRPVLLRVEAEGGHGVGKPLHKQVAEQADMWTFLAWQLGLDIPPAP